MESHDSYPVFHTRLLYTQRRRLTWPDGTSPGWLILNTADQLTETFADAASVVSNELTAMVHHDGSDPGDPPSLPLPRQR